MNDVQRFWSGRFWLKTPADFDGLDFTHGSQRWRCNVYCKLDIETTTVPDGAHDRYPNDPWLCGHDLTGYVGLALRGADGRPIGHVAIVSSRRLELRSEELDALRIFGARAAAELDRRRHETMLRRRSNRFMVSRAAVRLVPRSSG